MLQEKPEIVDAIQIHLSKIEKEYNVRILYAVESGSRAWGFASTDSDYDVRFVYIHTEDWYLSIKENRDVIEIPISDVLDISGWEIRKALNLFNKSNPPLLEWLCSPIVYQENFGFAENLRQFLKESFSVERCFHHYMHMAKGNFREYLKGDLVRLKKYFYVLRPVFACAWLEKHQTMPPTEFEKLYLDLELPLSLVTEIDRLLERKKAGEELDAEPKIEAINLYLEKMIKHFSSTAKVVTKRENDISRLDLLFKEMLYKAWALS